MCNEKGKKLVSLFKAVSAPDHKLQELKNYVKISFQEEHGVKIEALALPKEYKPLHDVSTSEVTVRQALRYLKERGINSTDIKRYNLGYCESGRYKDMIIIPSYDENGTLNYFVGRNFGPGDIKYKNPEHPKILFHSN